MNVSEETFGSVGREGMAAQTVHLNLKPIGTLLAEINERLLQNVRLRAAHPVLWRKLKEPPTENFRPAVLLSL